MTKGRPVLLVAGPESLPGAETAIRALNRPCTRVTPFAFEPVPVGKLRRCLEGCALPPTTVVVTSPEAARTFLEPLATDLRDCEIIVAGPSTREHVHALGFSRVTEGRPMGERGVVGALDRQRARRVVYPRSDRAGPRLSQQLRSQGHTVLDLVAYRIVPRAVPRRALARLSTPFTLVVSSPSALSELRRRMGVRQFARFRRMARPLVFGPKTARALRGHGLRDVRIASAPHSNGSQDGAVLGSVLRALREER